MTWRSPYGRAERVPHARRVPHPDGGAKVGRVDFDRRRRENLGNHFQNGGMIMRRAGCVFLTALVISLAASSARAQDDADKKKPKPKPDCLDGVFYDDGRFERGLAPGALADRDDLVMLFEAPSYPALLKKVCLNFFRNGFDTAIFFDLHVWSADGPDGSPGRLLYEVPTLGGGGIPPGESSWISMSREQE